VVSSLVRLAFALLPFPRLWKSDRQEVRCGDTTPWIAETDNRILVVKPLPYAHSALVRCRALRSLHRHCDAIGAEVDAHQTRRWICLQLGAACDDAALPV